jgi:hypothetical protein
VPPRLQALWISRALHRLWVAGVALADWQFLIDPYPDLQLATPTGGAVTVSRPAGLYSAAPGGNPALARPKPFLRGFSFPFDPLRVDRAHVRVWALLAHPRQAILLQRLTPAPALPPAAPAHAPPPRAWRTIARLHAARDAVLNTLVALRGPAELRVVSGPLTSASASVGPGRSRP